MLGSSYPGVAQFGSALEWGSRGREFDSRHSDQKPLIERSMAFLCTLKSANLEKTAEWRTGGFAERWNRELYAFKIAQPGGTKQSFCIFVKEKVDIWQFNGV